MIFYMVCLAGIEPATPRLGGECSIQLSYKHIFIVCIIAYLLSFFKLINKYILTYLLFYTLYFAFTICYLHVIIYFRILFL